MQIIDPKTTPMPDWLQPNGVMRLMPAAELDRWSRTSRLMWCHINARYGLPTVELVDWLRKRIAGRSAIEIGAGAGDLCHHLRIHGTDSKVQRYNPTAALYYLAMGQPTINYPDWVEEIDAVEAVRRYAPEVVVASWVTNWIDPNDPTPRRGCMFGVHEDQLLATGCEYIFIGNLAVHRHKPIMAMPHQEIEMPFLRSRAEQSHLNRVIIWQAAAFSD